MATPPTSASAITPALGRARRLGLGLVCLWFLAGGLGHFVLTDFFVRITPPWVPWPRAVVLASGAVELLLAAALLWPRWRRRAGLALMLLTVAVTPANLHMWLHPAQFPEFPEPLLALRLGVQVLFVGCIWWSTQAPVAPTPQPAQGRAGG